MDAVLVWVLLLGLAAACGAGGNGNDDGVVIAEGNDGGEADGNPEEETGNGGEADGNPEEETGNGGEADGTPDEEEGNGGEADGTPDEEEGNGGEADGTPDEEEGNGGEGEDHASGDDEPIDVLFRRLLEEGKCADAVGKADKLLDDEGADESLAAKVRVFRALALACLSEHELAQDDLDIAKEGRSDLDAESLSTLDRLDREGLPQGTEEVQDFLAVQP